MKSYLKISLIILALIYSLNLQAQITKKPVVIKEKSAGANAFALGITTNQVYGISAQSMFSFDENVTEVGGSFNGSQPGIEARFTYNLDEDGSFRLPVGLNYEFYSSRELLPLTNTVLDVKLQHNLEIISPYVGLEYRFFKLPKANAYIYGGIDMRAVYITNIMYRSIIEDRITGRRELDNSAAKDDALRYGINYRIGLEGEIYENYEINASVGLNVVNLIGKDGNRGELLTPIPRSLPISTENKETLVYSLYLSILAQYRF